MNDLKGEIIQKYAAVFVGLVVLTVYYPVLSAPFVSLDDFSLIQRLTDFDRPYTVKAVIDLFRPHSIDRYFRPLLHVTYILDSKIWFHQASGYHLTNYLLHLINSLILYGIALKLVVSSPNRKKWACISALLFSIHPLTCESVAWVSGRSDLLAGFFSLLAFYCYLSAFRGKSILCAVCIFAGVLSKESILAMLPIIILTHVAMMVRGGKKIKTVFLSTCYWIVILLVPIVVYAYLRMNGLETLDHGVKMSLSNKATAGNSTFQLDLALYVIAVIAFYLKKLFIPIPLNFAISQINVGLYVSLFLLLTGMIVYWAIKNKWGRVLWPILIIVSFAPALLVAMSKMAWTPLAERYLYLTVTVWALAMTTLAQSIIQGKPELSKPVTYILCLIILVFSTTTFARTLVWRDNRKLWADTYQKNPSYGKVLYKYGESLGEDKGIPYFQQAVATVPDNEWKDYSLLALAKHAIKEQRYDNAAGFIDRALEIRKTPENYYMAANIVMSMDGLDSLDKKENLKKCIDYFLSAYRIRKDPFALYQIAMLHSQLNNMKEAYNYYKKITKGFPDSNYAAMAKSRLGTRR